MAIQLYDSLTRGTKALGQREPGVPPVSKKHPFTFYNCGPTVYGPAHIGNFRTFVINDVLRRLLILEFGEDQVRYVRNLTDVDDKTIRRARDEDRPLAEVTKQWIDKFHADCVALNCLPLDPNCEPAATGHIGQQRDMINVLLQKGHAYCTSDGSVYFKVASFPGYGALSRLKERELQPGAALLDKPQSADADEKEDGSDFALWKAWKPEDGAVKWQGPTGAAYGRPGWHIECSAMSKALLGDTIDLHTGGEDLEFPHHENEIAQSECSNGVQFSRHWYHTKHLLVDGKKMSKSLGNLYTLDDLLKRFPHEEMAVRYALLAGHPRKQLNFSFESLGAAIKAVGTLDRVRGDFVQKFGSIVGADPNTRFDAVLDALRDDLNTPAALGALFSTLKAFGPKSPSATTSDFAAYERVLKAFGFSFPAAQNLGMSVPRFPVVECQPKIAALAEKRWAARQAKDFKTADALRAELAAAGWAMLDGKDGYKLEPLKKP